MKRVRVFAGPNGAGKSTLARLLGKEFNPAGIIHLHRFINADDLLDQLSQPDGMVRSVLGTALTWPQLRKRMVATGRVTPQHPFLIGARMRRGRLAAPPGAADAYLAAALAEVLRDDACEHGESFTFETVMSHPSKIAFLTHAGERGYRRYLYFVGTEMVELNLGRIQTRIELGGHAVPGAKVVERYRRCMALLRQAIANCDRAYLFDNSFRKPRLVAEKPLGGTLIASVRASRMPRWCLRHAL